MSRYVTLLVNEEVRTVNIKEAIDARTHDCPFITRLDWEKEWPDSKLKIYPTNTPDCCVVCSTATRNPQARWNPTIDDLAACDWIVVD